MWCKSVRFRAAADAIQDLVPNDFSQTNIDTKGVYEADAKSADCSCGQHEGLEEL